MFRKWFNRGKETQHSRIRSARQAPQADREADRKPQPNSARAEPPAPSSPPAQGEAGWQRRERQAVDSLLENEGLTGDLEDAAAKELVNWGVALARLAVQSTAALSDDQAESVMEEQLRATRQMMRSVSDWALEADASDAQASEQLLDQVAGQMVVLRGEGFLPPDETRRQEFLKQLPRIADQPAQKIILLRGLF